MTAAELQEVVAHMTGVRCNNTAQVVFELEKAERALKNDKGSPQMRRFQGALRMGVLRDADDARRGQLIRQLVLPAAQPSARLDTETQERRRQDTEDGGEELFGRDSHFGGGRATRPKRRDRDSSDSDSDSGSDEYSDDEHPDTTRRAHKMPKGMPKKRALLGEIEELLAPGMKELDVASIVFDGGKACDRVQLKLAT